MTDRVTDQRWWEAWEKFLRYQSHADAAHKAANHKATPPSLVSELLERHARFSLLASEARKQAKVYEQ